MKLATTLTNPYGSRTVRAGVLGAVATCFGLAGALVAQAEPAHADDAAGSPHAEFYGTCTNNYVAYWVTDFGPGEDIDDYAGGTNFRIYVRDDLARQEILFPGDYRELHRYFRRDGVAKTVFVLADGVVLGSHTYRCDADSKRHR